MGILKNMDFVLHLYTNGYLEALNYDRISSIIGKSFLFRLKTIFIQIIKEFKLLFYKNPKLNIENKIVCIINSKTNYDALKFLDFKDVVFLKPTVLGKSIEGVITYRFKNKFFYSLYLIIFLPLLLLKKENKQNVLLLHKAYGLTNLFNKLVQKQRPRKVVFANDHIPEARSYILACQELKIETVYIQHGTVSKYFPPLEFNLALLESQYSLDIYKRSKDINTEIKLIGMPKLDKEILKIRKRDNINKIGIAINQNDDLQKVEILAQTLIENNYKIILRKHPADIRKLNSNFDVENGDNGSVFEFIEKSDFLLASDSSIHVEANSLKCRSAYFQLHDNSNKYDYYNFVKNKYIDEIKNINNLIPYLKKFDYNCFDFYGSKLVYYNAALNDKLYGKSSNSALKFINND